MEFDRNIPQDSYEESELLKRRMIFLASPIVVTMLVLVAWYLVVGAANDGMPATEGQKQDFLSLIRRQERTFFEGWVTGDLSEFPAVYYNDPHDKPNGHRQDLVKTYRDEIDAILADTDSGPVGGRSGELAAQMADVLWRRQSDVQWQAAVATATAEGRNPTLSDMPDGNPPATTPQQSDWVEQPIFIVYAMIQGETHASVIYVLGDGDPTPQYHLDLTNVNGTWYVSKDWVTGNP
jgi:hypothetical protein